MFFLQLVNETSLYVESTVHRAQNLADLFSWVLACCKAQCLLPECWFSVDLDSGICGPGSLLTIPFSFPGKHCLDLPWSQSCFLCVIQLLFKWITHLLDLEDMRSSPEDTIVPAKRETSRCFPNGSRHETPSINYQVVCRCNCPVIAWTHAVTRCVYKSLVVW